MSLVGNWNVRLVFKVLLVVAVAAIILGSTWPHTAGPSSHDKLNHFVAYAIVSTFAIFSFTGLTTQLRCFLFLILLGIGLEFVQSQIPHRHFEFLDIMANTLGVLIAALLGYIFILANQRIFAKHVDSLCD